ncbi:hypothetical protein MP228_009127 [Amoeboaphelidium protococcarum]|nr:hypothetical protein MP228_009127 [Amoeboaphelidium protococcarum]
MSVSVSEMVNSEKNAIKDSKSYGLQSMICQALPVSCGDVSCPSLSDQALSPSIETYEYFSAPTQGCSNQCSIERCNGDLQLDWAGILFSDCESDDEPIVLYSAGIAVNPSYQALNLIPIEEHHLLSSLQEQSQTISAFNRKLLNNSNTNKLTSKSSDEIMHCVKIDTAGATDRLTNNGTNGGPLSPTTRAALLSPPGFDHPKYNNKNNKLSNIEVLKDQTTVKSKRQKKDVRGKIKSVMTDSPLVFKRGKAAYNTHNYGWKWLQDVEANQMVIIKNLDLAVCKQIAAACQFKLPDTLQKLDKAASGVLKSLFQAMMTISVKIVKSDVVDGASDKSVMFVHNVMMGRLRRLDVDVSKFENAQAPYLVVLSDSDTAESFVKLFSQVISTANTNECFILNQREFPSVVARHLIQPHAYPLKYPGDDVEVMKQEQKAPVLVPCYLVLAVQSTEDLKKSAEVSPGSSDPFLVCNASMASTTVQHYNRTLDNGFDAFCVVYESSSSTISGWFKVIRVDQSQSQQSKAKLIDVTLKLAPIKKMEIQVGVAQKIYDIYFNRNFNLKDVSSCQMNKSGQPTVLNLVQDDAYNLSWVVNTVQDMQDKNVDVNLVITQLLLSHMTYRQSKGHKYLKNQAIHGGYYGNAPTVFGNSSAGAYAPNADDKSLFPSLCEPQLLSQFKIASQKNSVVSQSSSDSEGKSYAKAVRKPQVKSEAKAIKAAQQESSDSKKVMEPRTLAQIKNSKSKVSNSWADFDSDDEMDYGTPLFASQALFEDKLDSSNTSSSKTSGQVTQSNSFNSQLVKAADEASTAKQTLVQRQR